MYCVIDNKLLKLYTDPSRDLLEGILDFDLLNCDVSVNERINEFSIKIEGASVVFSFKADSPELLDTWVKEIQTHIKMGVGKQLPDLAHRMS